MVEVKNGKKILTTPISAEDLKDIKIGDIVYLNGSMTTCRDVAHRRLVEEGRELPVDVRNNAIFHAGPIIRPLENDKFEMVSVGPTTSMRMEKFEYEFVKETGVRVIIDRNNQWSEFFYAAVPECLWHSEISPLSSYDLFNLCCCYYGITSREYAVDCSELFTCTFGVFFHSTFSDDHPSIGK